MLLLLFGIATSVLAAIKDDLIKGEFTVKNSKQFNSSVEQLTQTVLLVMKDYGIRIQAQDIQTDQAMITGDKGVTAWSWGENVGVLIKKLDQTTALVKVISKPKLVTNVTAKNWTSDILSGISAQLQQMRDGQRNESYDVAKQNEDWLVSINKGLTAAMSFDDHPALAISCEGRFGDYIAGKIINFVGNRNPNIDIVATGKELTQILEQQKLSLTGLYDEKTAVEVGRLIGAKYFFVCTPYFKEGSPLAELHCKLVNIQTGKFLGGGMIVFLDKKELPEL